ncbi:hypothetical protein DERF_001971 [Dermatophagoides farinae]|uniref:Uncharacterized protein n=1 Tax=Dermatophagoides farinae TaxID=6954 RepID=A0A922I9N9_DERFA|nr:hypothetical protein DERF_001971 [Dermatophagoides farinae]
MFILRRSQQKLKVPSIWFFIFGFYIIILMNHSILTCAKPIDTAKYLPLIKEHASPNTLAAIAEAEVQESAKHYTHKKPKYHKMYPESPQAVPHSLKQIAGHYSNIYQPPFPYKKVRHHHYHPIVLYKNFCLLSSSSCCSTSSSSSLLSSLFCSISSSVLSSSSASEDFSCGA